ncbi:MAG: toll/interleukin-1 receptor domain-containing protein [Defluviitaleaceae bacterium]|nr:toll/interleukin-1 receptor domain-containing protein [Defluviitaleaceae bacterium]
MDWDVFISHASEDKASLVEPLALKLRSYGVNVWYDKFELKIGDSLSGSIDAGLASSKFGLVIISEAFLSKNWPDYELRSLISKEINNGKTILPIWHDISKERLLKYSPFLADKMALDSKIGMDALTIKIIDVVRPDILNSFMHKEAFRKINEKNSGDEISNIEISKLVAGPIIHKELSLHLVYLSMIFSRIFADTLGSDYKSFAENFARDWDYEPEVRVWIIISLSFLDFIAHNDIISNNIDKKKAAFRCLISISINDFDNNNDNISDIEYMQLLKLYSNYAKWTETILSRENSKR